MVESVPPSFISDSASFAMRIKDQQETSMASRKPSFEQSTTRPCRSAFGAKAMECTQISSFPHSVVCPLNPPPPRPPRHCVRGKKRRPPPPFGGGPRKGFFLGLGGGVGV